jgi:hypothetical protein
MLIELVSLELETFPAVSKSRVVATLLGKIGASG